MSSQEEQIQQRRSNLEELAKLGVEIYPRRFDRRHTISELVGQYGERTHDELEAARIETKTSGRILAIRSFGKANFLVLSDGIARIQVYIRPGRAAAARFPDLQAARFRRLGRRRRPSVPDENQRADDLGVAAALSLEVPASVAGEVARADRHRNPVPPAVPRSHRQPGRAAGLRDAEPRDRVDSRVHDRARVSGSRDADDAADRRRRAGAALQDPSQHARHGPLLEDRARALSEAADGGRHREGL